MKHPRKESSISPLHLCAAIPLVVSGLAALALAAEVVGPMTGIIAAGIIAAIGLMAAFWFGKWTWKPAERDVNQVTADESLRTLAQFIPGVLYSYDLYEGQPRRSTYLSPGFEELLGPRVGAEIANRFDHLFERIHPDDWPRLRRQATEATIRGEAINAEARLRRDDGSYRWVRSFGRPMALPNGGVRWYVVLVDIQDQKDLEEQHLLVEEQLRESERQLRLITDSLPVLISYIDRTETFRFVNAAYQKWWGKPGHEICGSTIRDLLGDSNYDVVRQYVRRALRGESMSYESVIVDAFGTVRETHCMYVPRRTSNGDVQGVYAVVTDISTMRHDERRRRLLMRELDHRVKNNLASVLSLAHQTLERSSTLAEFAPAFFGRIHAMAKSHELLAEAQWSGLDLERGARLVLGPYLDVDERRIELSGPPVAIPAASALPLCLTLHELATNAAKYGSLSVSDGRVAVSWNVEGEKKLKLHWAERSGPPVTTEHARGTGMDLIRGFIEFELRGSMRTDFNPEGLECAIEIALDPPRERINDRAPAPIQSHPPASNDNQVAIIGIQQTGSSHADSIQSR